MGKYYILENKKIKPIADLLEWGRWFEKKENRIVDQTREGDVLISTVFLGLDHRFSYDESAPPLVFETMIFGGPHDQFQERYCTWDEAVAGHNRAIEKVRSKPKSKAMPKLEEWYQFENWRQRLGFDPVELIATVDVSEPWEMDSLHLFKLRSKRYAVVSERGCSCYESSMADIDILPTMKAVKERLRNEKSNASKAMLEKLLSKGKV